MSGMNDILGTSGEMLSIVRQQVLGMIRNHADPAWSEDDYGWLGVQYVWRYLELICQGDVVVDEDGLSGALLDMEVPRECIRREGPLTCIELDNVSFVYQACLHGDLRRPVEITPYRKGDEFKPGGLDLIESTPVSAYDIVQVMIVLDRTCPEFKAVIRQARQDGMRERTVREIKASVAGAFLNDLFGGSRPEEITGFEIADTGSGTMDLIRLKIDNPGFWWQGRYFDIPYDDRELLRPEDLTGFIRDESLEAGALVVLTDGETGAKYPIFL